MNHFRLTVNRGWSLLGKASYLADTCGDEDDAQAAIVLAFSAAEAFLKEPTGCGVAPPNSARLTGAACCRARYLLPYASS
jgi:hypothetical protein